MIGARFYYLLSRLTHNTRPVCIFGYPAVGWWIINEAITKPGYGTCEPLEVGHV